MSRAWRAFWRDTPNTWGGTFVGAMSSAFVADHLVALHVNFLFAVLPMAALGRALGTALDAPWRR